MEQEVKNNEQQNNNQKSSKNGKNWIGNIVKEQKPIQTKEEYWSEVRGEILNEYLSLFDTTKSEAVKRILKESSKVKEEYRFRISMHTFKELTESDFKELKQYTDNVKIRSCNPGDLLLAILYKKEIEKYKINLKLSEQSIKDIFNDNWENFFYTVYFS